MLIPTPCPASPLPTGPAQSQAETQQAMNCLLSQIIQEEARQDQASRDTYLQSTMKAPNSNVPGCEESSPYYDAGWCEAYLQGQPQPVPFYQDANNAALLPWLAVGMAAILVLCAVALTLVRLIRR